MSAGEPDPELVFVPNVPEQSQQPVPAEPKSPQTPVDHMDHSLSRFAPLSFLERVTGIPKVFLVATAALCACAALVYYAGLNATGKAISFVVPAYMTYKTLEGDHAQEHIHWLTYWVVYGVFEATRVFSDAAFHWLPYWEITKFVFLVWCALPQTRGCSFMYRAILRPLFKHNEQTLDRHFERIGRHVVQIAAEVRDVIAEILKAIFFAVMHTVVNMPANVAGSASKAEAAPAADLGARNSPELQKKQF